MRRLDKAISNTYNDIYYFILSIVNNEEVAVELTQRTMELAILNKGKLRDAEKLKAWMFAIARNVINEHYRDIKAYRKRFETYDEMFEDDLHAVSQEELENDILRILVDRERSLLLCRLLDELDQKYFDVINLHILCGYSQLRQQNFLA